MLALTSPSSPLAAVEQFGLDVLVDCSRLLVAPPETDAVRLTVVGDAGGAALSIADARARAWTIERGEGEVRISRAALRLVGEVAGAVAEQRATARDRFGRVPSAENAVVAAGAERDPVVQRIAIALRGAVIAAAGRRPLRLLTPWPDAHRWAAALTHDLDVVSLWPAFTLLRLLELAKKGEAVRALRVVGSSLRELAANPVARGIRMVLDCERAAAIRSTWFILTGTPTLATIRAGDLTYVPESPTARRILGDVAAAGHALGLHGSFATYTDAELFAAQRSRLAAITGAPPAGVRQHFLRMVPGETQRAMQQAGFRFDSTFGYADRNGFRLGIADVVPTWDAAAQQRLDLDEAPFVWMDRALSKYAGVEAPAAWVDDALALAAICREVEGLWVGIWHPNLTPALGYPDTPDAYRRLTTALAADGPWLAPLPDIVEWRRARRGARAIALRPDGTVAFRGAAAGARTLHLEAADSSPLSDRPEQ